MKKISADRVKLALTLFLSYFKIGLFTFGGGYAMIALIEREFVVRKKWISEVELYEIIAIAESTPGPIAINCATFVGYKVCGFIGSFLATLAVCIPSFAIIYLISIFYDEFMALTAVAYAFEGIKAGIAIMITVAGVNMMRKAKKNAFSLGVFLLTFAAAICIDLFSLDFSTVYIILTGAAAGIILQIIKDVVAKKKGRAQKEESGESTGTARTGEASRIICKEGAYTFGIGERLKDGATAESGERAGEDMTGTDESDGQERAGYDGADEKEENGEKEDASVSGRDEAEGGEK